MPVEKLEGQQPPKLKVFQPLRNGEGSPVFELGGEVEKKRHQKDPEIGDQEPLHHRRARQSPWRSHGGLPKVVSIRVSHLLRGQVTPDSAALKPSSGSAGTQKLDK